MKARLSFLLAILATAGPAESWAQAAPFEATPIGESELAGARAGFMLPGGIEVAIGVRITTDVNGQRLLETIWKAEGATVWATGRTADGDAQFLDPHAASMRGELPGLVVETFVGDRISTYLANTADGRSIDHRVAVDLSLGSVQPFSIGSGLFRAQAPGLEASTLRAVGS
ncbi:MAG: hypothetical protein J7500_14295 [Sphingomonas sp.]|uniref:hypothetical protein n=1 Tax=Sphingomonas sp. TaxID=28214 RepID=UPI001B0FEF7F|nr:hypothetical protein [Sphingomonas sp.]MBO9623875.1 hypothetical protein [Sphingomonas sp.]